MKIHITGFTTEEKTYIAHLAIDLNLTIEENFNTTVELVVVKSILVQKYRLAKILNVKIVAKNWIIDSHKEKRLLPTSNYETAALEDLKIYLYGFDPFFSKNIEEAAIQHKAIILKDIDDLRIDGDIPKFVVYNDESSFNINDPEYRVLYELKTKIFIVNYEWFITCIKEERFIQTDYFLHPICKLVLPKIRIRVEANNLETLLNGQDVNAHNYSVLESCVFYFHKSDTGGNTSRANTNTFNKVPEPQNTIDVKLQSKLVNLLGGFSITKKIKNITHVVCSSIDENEMKALKKSGSVYFVNGNYIKDCLLYKKRLLEVEYSPVVVLSIDIGSNADGFNSHIDDRQDSISGTYTQMKTIRTPTSMPINKNVPKFKSFLFENLLFYFDKGITNLKESQRKILENSGDILIELKAKKIKYDKLFYLLDDGYDPKVYAGIETSIPDVKIIFISPRWIDYCLERKIAIKDIKTSRLPHLLPFAHKMPLSDFADKVIATKGFGPTETYGLEELIRVVGAKFTSLDELTDENLIVVCDKAEEYMFEDKCEVKPSKWLFECISKGKFI